MAPLKLSRLGTHQGNADWNYLTLYLDEFALRFNWHTSRYRGLVFLRLLVQAVAPGPAPYRELIVTPRLKRIQPTHPSPASRSQMLTLERPRERCPWRN